MRGVVAIDLETTGLDVSSAHIIEIGAVKFRDHEILDTYTTLVNPPDGPDSRQNYGDYWIHQKDIDWAPTLQAVLPTLQQFVGSAPVIGHNIDFDMAFLQKQGILKDNLSIDTYEMASALLPTAPALQPGMR